MKKTVYTIQSNERIAEATYRMTLAGDTSAISRPGQFINIALDGFYLRRPISVSDWDDSTITIIYKAVGRGTEAMTDYRLGKRLDVLAGLGNGYDIEKAARKRILLVGGGCGVPPLIGLAKRLKARGETVFAALGFENAASVFGVDAFEQHEVATGFSCVDGSAGVKGFVTEIIKEQAYDYYFACGPEGMLRAVHALGKEGQLSFEERMGCGFGACMGCSCKTLTGYKRICVDGPVLESGEVSFDGK